MDYSASLTATQLEKNSAEIIRFENPAKQEYVDAIRLWCVDRSLENALTREEIGAMRKDDRIDAQRKALVIGFAQFLRDNPRSDVALGVYLVTTLLSDNEKGCANVSQPTMSKLFGRSISSIGDAQRRLKEQGLIVMGRGRYAGNYPVIPRAVTHSYNHMVWLVEAIKDHDKPLNLPAPPVDCQTTGPTGGLRSINRPEQRIEKVQSTGQDVSINRPDAHLLHSNNSTTLNLASRAAAIGLATAMGALPVAAEPREPAAIVQPAKLSLGEMHKRMFEAAGDALEDPITAPKLSTFVELQSWLGSGCDFETDILQTIRSVAANRMPRSISTWTYFRRAIADAKATRLKPMPEGRLAAPPGKRLAPWEEEEIRRSRQADEALERLRKKYEES